MPCRRHDPSPSRRGTKSAALLLAIPALAALAALGTPAGPARADGSAWPRHFESSSGSFVIFQPQPEELDDDLLTGRAAFSLKKTGHAYPR